MLLVARPSADPERSRTSSVLDDLEAGLAHSPMASGGRSLLVRESSALLTLGAQEASHDPLTLGASS